MGESESGKIDYAAVLADLLEQRANLDTMIAATRKMLGQAGADDPAPGGAPNPGGGGNTKPGDFLGLSIPNATKKLLESKRAKQSTQDIIDALEKGGLPRSTYQSVYGILLRREKQVGDIIRMRGDWALSAWYPNHVRAKISSPEKPEPKAPPKKKFKIKLKPKAPAAAKDPEPATDESPAA